MDWASFLGLFIGLAAIGIGNIIEGGNTGHLIQLAAALIVLGGTFGATLLSFSMADLLGALKALKRVFFASTYDVNYVIEDILRILAKARKIGIIALEGEVKNIEHPFLRKGLNLIIDGVQPAMVKEILYREIDTYEDSQRKVAKVYETAGGYAPTIGILGAVLGLIQVMQNVTDPSKIGSGIAVAFVATIYGVGSANLLFLPIAKKINNRTNEELVIMELIIEGIMGIESGLNPYFLKQRLLAFVSKEKKS